MRLALDRIIATSPASKEHCLDFSMRANVETGYPFYARIWAFAGYEACYGFGYTPDEAADEAIKAFGTADKRRDDAINKLKSEAAALGLELVDPAQTESSTEALAD